MSENFNNYGEIKRLSYNNDQTKKDFYVQRMEKHAELDEIIKGAYWENGKGCAIGCAMENERPHSIFQTEIYDEWLSRLADTLFEGCSNKYAKVFAVEFFKAIPIGKNLDSVKTKFVVFLLDENYKRIEGLKNLDDKIKTQVLEIIKIVKNYHESGDTSESATRAAAESAAWAARSARSAAESARSARSAAWFARSAAWAAAESAAWSTARAAAESARFPRSAGESAAYDRYAKKLLQLLKEAN